MWLSHHRPSVMDTDPDVTLFRVFKQQWMKDDKNHLPVNYQQSLPNQWARAQHHPEHKTPSTELTTQMQCSSWAYTLISTELTTPVQCSLRVRAKEQTFHIVSKRIVDTSYHYKLSYNMLLKFLQTCETVWLSLSDWKTLPVSLELTVQERSQTK